MGPIDGWAGEGLEGSYSINLTGVEFLPPCYPADLNGNGVVGFDDVLQIIAEAAVELAVEFVPDQWRINRHPATGERDSGVEDELVIAAKEVASLECAENSVDVEATNENAEEHLLAL